MAIQIIMVVIFAINLLFIWLTFLTAKFNWYRLPGSLIFVFLPILTVFFNQPRFELDYFWWKIAGAAAILIGTGVLSWAVIEFQKLKLKVLGLPETMVTSGPYKYVRHPQYLGLIFIFVGWWWVWAAAYAFYFGMFILALIWVQGYLEEKLILEKQFGNKYREYRQQTGMFWIK